MNTSGYDTSIFDNLPDDDNNNTGDEFLPISLLEETVQEHVLGQEKAMKSISTAFYRSIYLNLRSVTLVIGPSGCGKTLSLQRYCHELNLPYTHETITQYTQEGYQGASINQMLTNLFLNAGKDLDRAEHGILIIDEIDKKAGMESNGRDISGKEVLNSLLPILSGAEMLIPIDSMRQIKFNTKHLIIFLLGAFVGLDAVKDQRLEKKTLGFAPQSKETSWKDLSPEKSPYTKSDLIKYGLTPEFVGRINKIVTMNDLSTNDLISIVKKSKESDYTKIVSALNSYGINVIVQDDFFEEIAKSTLNFGTGARELSNTINYSFDKILHDIFNAEPNTYSQVELFSGITKDNSKFKLS